MYIRRVKTKNKETGTDYFTYRLVKNIRESGMPKQINLISLGKLDDVSETELPLLSQRIESLYNHEPFLFSGTFPKHIEEKAHFFTRKLIQKKFVEKVDLLSDNQEYATEKQFVEIDINSTLGQEAANIGGEFLCKQAINELGLDTFLKDELHYTDSELTNSMLSIIGRLLYSSNEYQTARWLNDNSAIQEFYPLESGHVTKNQLYSAAKQLYKDKDAIERYLNRTIEQTFDLRRKIVLYDLTNTHFEGMMQESKKAKHGRNKQKRTDCRQVTLGMLTDEHGFPIHTQYYEGNIAENKTFEKILTDLSSYGTNLFAEEKPCIIMYRLLNEIEDAFGTLKSELKIRPNFHHSDATIEAHINLCVLSYYIVSFIRYRLKKNGIKHDWDEIRRLMSTQKKCTQVSCTREEKALWTKYCTRPTPEVEQIYDIMGYKKIPFYRKNIVV